MVQVRHDPDGKEKRRARKGERRCGGTWVDPQSGCKNCLCPVLNRDAKVKPSRVTCTKTGGLCRADDYSGDCLHYTSDGWPRLTHNEKLLHIAVVLRDIGCRDYADYIETIPAALAAGVAEVVFHGVTTDLAEALRKDNERLRAVLDRYLTLHDHESGGACGCDICREVRAKGVEE